LFFSVTVNFWSRREKAAPLASSPARISVRDDCPSQEIPSTCRFLQGGGCAGRSPDEPGDGVMTVPEYSMRSGEIFLKREEKAGKFLFEVFSRVFPLVATA